jgi:nucleotide-binding universal stress UspA family protein
MSTLVTLATYERSKTAYFLKDLLGKEGIDCFFAFIYNDVRNADEIRVQVKEEDVEGAIQVMIGIRDQYGRNIEEIEPEVRTKMILVPTDFSEGSENACHYAVHLAQKLKAEIKILHVYENPLTDMGVKESATYERYAIHMVKEMEKKVKEDIVAFTRKIRDYVTSFGIEDVNVYSSTVMGKTVRRIKEICKVSRPDLIVLGTVGKREDESSVFAGIANELVMGLDIPLYAIPGPFTLEDLEKVNILYATDFNEKDNTSLNHLLEIVAAFDKRITCVHIDTAHNPSKQERMDELNKILQKEYSQQQISCRLIEDEDVYHGIHSFAEQHGINLLSFTTQKRGIFEKLFRPNLFRKILQESNLPILIFPS